ncbi:hypothetical protein RHMOL_Rhmol10G0167400 [Rhododendron molle]|uniref:Uncharacterized protein n=1 Tax=Rhododendron molle TaxID=49168 RepID=A0ACC0M375_RHOML|nr:hypothetical protein RHMOL_Rhmol10G0167400 [Rhododendron molle]
MVKEARFEPGSSMNVLKVCWISLSSATRKDGLKLVRLGIEPWLGKLILQCFEHRLGKEGLVLAAIMPNASSIFCKMGNEEDKLKFGHYKVSFEQQTCLSSLSENVAMYSGYDQLGCEVALTGKHVRLHPSCSLVWRIGRRKLTGFCYCGGERKVNANGTFLYNGGMCVAVLLEEGSQLNELLEKSLDFIDAPNAIVIHMAITNLIHLRAVLLKNDVFNLTTDGLKLALNLGWKQSCFQWFEHHFGKEGLVLPAIMPNASTIFCSNM